MKEGFLYEPTEEQSVVCNLCAHRCLIRPGRIGICGVRENRAGVLYTLVYDRVIAAHADPIEKKPLFHFLPGTSSFSIATMGCNFHCLFCQNWDISQIPKDRHGPILGKKLSPEQIVHKALKSRCTTIAYTYTEPTIFLELAYDTAKLAVTQGLKNIFVTNGYMTLEALIMMQPYLHAANVDLKGFDDTRHRRVCGATLQPVLDTIRRMKELGIWVEVTTLVIPGHNDSDGELTQIAQFLKSVGEDIPWHLSAFFPAYKMRAVEPTDTATLQRAWQIGKAAGLRYVYCGNLPGSLHEGTDCYHCGRRVVEREGFNVQRIALHKGRCPYCQTGHRRHLGGNPGSGDHRTTINPISRGGTPMSTTGLDVFDTTLQKTHVWLNEIMTELGWEDNRHWAYLALRTVLHTLRDHLTVEEAMHLGAQLPMLIRGFYYEGWTLTGKPVKERRKEEFLAHIKQAFRNDERIDPEEVVRAVFRVLSRRITAGEISDVKHLLPAALRELWS